MTEEEKASILNVLYVTKKHLEPITEKKVAETRATYDSMMEGIAKIGFPDLATELTVSASQLLGYVEEHKLRWKLCSGLLTL
jgi:hypothetical protein